MSRAVSALILVVCVVVLLGYGCSCGAILTRFNGRCLRIQMRSHRFSQSPGIDARDRGRENQEEREDALFATPGHDRERGEDDVAFPSPTLYTLVERTGIGSGKE